MMAEPPGSIGPFSEALGLLSGTAASMGAESMGAVSMGEDAWPQLGAEFYGVKAQGSRFVFVVDSSRSMHVRRVLNRPYAN